MLVLLKNVRLSFPSLFKASSFGAEEPKFSATFLLDKGGDNEKLLSDAINKVAQDAFGNNWQNILKKQYSEKSRILMKDGDNKLDKDGNQAVGYAGKLFVKASNKVQPLVIGRQKQPLNENSGTPYAGCMVNAQIDVWAQDNKFGKFVNLKLLGVQFWGDNDAFGAASVASADAFESADEDTPW